MRYKVVQPAKNNHVVHRKPQLLAGFAQRCSLKALVAAFRPAAGKAHIARLPAKFGRAHLKQHRHSVSCFYKRQKHGSVPQVIPAVQLRRAPSQPLFYCSSYFL